MSRRRPEISAEISGAVLVLFRNRLRKSRRIFVSDCPDRLPCRYVIHAVGPVVRAGHVTPRNRAALIACYRESLSLAQNHGLRSLAFCCISTGGGSYPGAEAAQIALDTVRAHDAVKEEGMRVIFCMHTDADETLYARLLSEAGAAECGG